MHGANLALVGLFSTFISMGYLEHTGGKKGLILDMLRELKSQTQVITWEKKKTMEQQEEKGGKIHE